MKTTTRYIVTGAMSNGSLFHGGFESIEEARNWQRKALKDVQIDHFVIYCVASVFSASFKKENENGNIQKTTATSIAAR